MGKPRGRSNARRCSIARRVRTRYTVFCIFRYRRLPRSTALDVAPISRSSRNTSAFSNPGDSSFFNTARSRPDRRNRSRNAVSLAIAVAVRHRRSNNRWTSAISSRSTRNWGRPRLTRWSVARSEGLNRRWTNR